MRRIVGITGVGALIAAGLALSGPAQALTPQTGSVAGRTLTNFSLNASAYGTKVRGGDISVNSGRSALSIIACTRTAGLDRHNHVVGVNLGVGNATGVRSHTWTTSSNGVVAAHSSSTIATLTVGAVTINTIKASTRSWHNSTGYHSRAQTSVASITGGQGVPTAGNPITVAGVRIALGKRQARHGTAFAQARAVSLKITNLATNTQILAGYAFSRIDGNVTGGIFHGYANGSQVHVLGSTATSGKTSLLPIPCAGTRGQVKTTSTAQASVLNGAATLSGLKTSVYGVQGNGSAHGYTRAEVAKATLFGGRVRVKAVAAQANVALAQNGTLSRSAKGTTIGGIFFNGSRVKVGADRKVTLGSFARIRTHVVTRLRHGIDVVAVRIRLLSGPNNGSVIDLAHARLSITRS